MKTLKKMTNSQLNETKRVKIHAGLTEQQREDALIFNRELTKERERREQARKDKAIADQELKKELNKELYFNQLESARKGIQTTKNKCTFVLSQLTAKSNTVISLSFETAKTITKEMITRNAFDRLKKIFAEQVTAAERATARKVKETGNKDAKATDVPKMFSSATPVNVEMIVNGYTFDHNRYKTTIGKGLKFNPRNPYKFLYTLEFIVNTCLNVIEDHNDHSQEID